MKPWLEKGEDENGKENEDLKHVFFSFLQTHNLVH